MILKKIVNVFKNIFDTRRELDDSHQFWYWAALVFLVIAIRCVLWGDQDVPEEIMKMSGNKTWFSSEVRSDTINLQILKPDMTGMLASVFFMGILFIRGCIGSVRNPWVYVLIFGDVILFASFFGLLFSNDSVVLFTLPFLPDVSVTPRTLAVFIILLTCIGARSVAGFATILLVWAEFLVFRKADDALGIEGVVFILASFASLVLQLKLPGLSINKTFLQVFLEDVGRGVSKVKNETMKNLESTGRALENTGRAMSGEAKSVVMGGAPSVTGEEIATVESSETK